MATIWYRMFRVKAIPLSLGPAALYIMAAVSLDMCGSRGSIFYFKNCIPEPHTFSLSLKIICVSNKAPLHI